MATPLEEDTKPSFEFGTRTLTDESKVFEENAWDNVEFSEEMELEARKKISTQAEHRATEDEVARLDTEPCEFWNQFYKNNTNKFFKDRHWLKIEFPELFEAKRMAEIGCGAGNTVFPFLQSHTGDDVFAYACDYSAEAVGVVKSSPLYNEENCLSFVYDITSSTPPPAIEPGSLDVVVCIFVLSAIHPRHWEQAAANIFNMLKPGGKLLFRDYGRYDLAQLRFKKGRMLEDNFYCRGDGTRVYFFTNEELEKMFSQFTVKEIADVSLLAPGKVPETL